MRVGYARVSSQEQARDSAALDQQISRLNKAGAERIYCDVQSGADDDRPELQKLLTEVNAGLIDSLVITRIDRITRDSSFNLQLLKTFDKRKIRLTVLDMGGEVDVTNPYVWERLASAGIQGEMERRILSLRVKRGYEYHREQMKAPGPVPFGYIRKDDKYAPDPENWERAREMVELFLENRSLRPTCRAIEERHGKRWHPSGLKRWLENPVLQGHTGYLLNRANNPLRQKKPTYYYNTHPALITGKDAELIGQILKANIGLGKAKKASRNLPLRGLVYCDECGSRCRTNWSYSRGREYAYFVCRGHTANLVGNSPGRCPQKQIPVGTVEKAVIAELCKRASELLEEVEREVSITIVDSEDPEVAKLRTKLAGLQTMLSQFGSDAAIEMAISNLQREIEQRLTQGREEQVDTLERRETLREMADPSAWEDLEPIDRQDAYRWFIKRIWVRDKRVIRVELFV